MRKESEKTSKRECKGKEEKRTSKNLKNNWPAPDKNLVFLQLLPIFTKRMQKRCEIFLNVGANAGLLLCLYLL